MKNIVSVLPFCANLIINNRSKDPNLRENAHHLKNDFKYLTNNKPSSTLILSTNKNVAEDSFELVDAAGHSVARQSVEFSNHIESLSYEALTDRLLRIFELMNKKAKYASEIKKLQEKRAKQYIAMSKTAKDKTLSSADRDRAMLYHRYYIDAFDNSIKTLSNCAKADCDSFEIKHGLKKMYI